MPRRAEPRISDIDNHDRRYVSLTVAAIYLEVTRLELYKFLECGLIGYARFGRRRRIHIAELKRFDESRQVARAS